MFVVSEMLCRLYLLEAVSFTETDVFYNFRLSFFCLAVFLESVC